MLPWIIGGVGALAGAAAGSMPKTSSSTVNLGGASGLETRLGGYTPDTSSIDKQLQELYGRRINSNDGSINYSVQGDIQRLEEQKRQLESQRTKGLVEQDFDALRRMADLGPGESDISSGLESQRGLAAMLANYAKEGGADPTSGDMGRSQTLAESLFRPQEVLLQQAFQDQTTEANRRAALMGRSLNDPILAAKLAQEQTRQRNVFGAQRNAFATQYAMQQPLQRLGFQQDRTNILSGLATQAMANRQALLSMGNSMQQQERQWRLNTAGRTTNEGGGIGGAISGLVGGLGMGLSAASTLNNMSSWNKGISSETPVPSMPSYWDKNPYSR